MVILLSSCFLITICTENLHCTKFILPWGSSNFTNISLKYFFFLFFSLVFSLNGSMVRLIASFTHNLCQNAKFCQCWQCLCIQHIYVAVYTWQVIAEYFTPMERLCGISTMIVQKISFLMPAADLGVFLVLPAPVLSYKDVAQMAPV